MLELFTQLAPIFGPVAALFIVIAFLLYRDNQRLREERNKAVEKKDQDLKESNEKVMTITKEIITSNRDVKEALVAYKEESVLRAKTDEIKTDAIVKTLESIQSVLINISRK